MRLGSALFELHAPGLGTPPRRPVDRDRAGRRPGRRRAVHGDGPLVPDGAARRARRSRCSRATRARLPRRRHRAAAAQPAGHRRDLPPPGAAGQDRHHPRRAVRAGGRCSGSARPGTSASTWASACRSRRPASGSSGSRRRCRSSGRCGRTTRRRTPASTTSWRSPHRAAAGAVAPPDHGRRQRRAEDAATGRARTPTPATSSASTPDEMRHKLDVLRGHCDDAGRDYDAIEKTLMVPATRPTTRTASFPGWRSTPPSASR